MKLLELMHTDKYLLNLICYGIEGRDYTKDPNDENRMIRDSGGYYISEYLVGNQFLAYLVPSYEDDTVVYVNTTEYAYSDESVTIPAKDYLVERSGN